MAKNRRKTMADELDDAPEIDESEADEIEGDSLGDQLDVANKRIHALEEQVRALRTNGQEFGLFLTLPMALGNGDRKPGFRFCTFHCNDGVDMAEIVNVLANPRCFTATKI